MSNKVDDFGDFSSDDENNESNILITSKKTVSVNKDAFTNNDDDSENESDDDVEVNETEGKVVSEDDKLVGINKVEVEQIETLEDKASRLKKRMALVRNLKKNNSHKTGVVYLSSLPPYMKPAKMRQILSKFGELDRLFMKREKDEKHKRRLKSGGNKKTMYEEGWAEFIRKRDAKLCAYTLNGNIIGGKKGNFYYDDILNVKYLPGFKWADLTEQIANENDTRQAKLEIEISQANKLNADFIRNVEQSKMIENIQRSKNKKRVAAGNDGDDEQANRRNFKQHRVATNRSDAPSQIKNNKRSDNLDSVLTNIL